MIMAVSNIQYYSDDKPNTSEMKIHDILPVFYMLSQQWHSQEDAGKAQAHPILFSV